MKSIVTMPDNGKRYRRITYQQKQVRQAIEEVKKMKTSDKYHKWVEWSEKDHVRIGKCPDLT